MGKGVGVPDEWCEVGFEIFENWGLETESFGGLEEHYGLGVWGDEGYLCFEVA